MKKTFIILSFVVLTVLNINLPCHSMNLFDAPETDLQNWAFCLDYDKVTKILKKTNVNQKDADGETVLHFLARQTQKHVNSIESLTGQSYGKTSSFIEMAEFLIKNGANVNAKDKYGKTPLFYATPEMAKLLIKYGADVNAKNEFGDTILIDNCLFGKSENVKILLENGADVNAKNNKYGYTALHNASPYNKKSNEDSLCIIKYLISKGADVNAKKNKYGNTPLMDVADDLRFDYVHAHKIVELLINNGADVNVKNEKGETALDKATNINLAKYYNNDKNNEQIAIRRNDLEKTVKILLDNGAKPTNKSLFNAAYYGQYEIVKLLIDYGANINAKNEKGETALDFAKKTITRDFYCDDNQYEILKSDKRKTVELLQRAMNGEYKKESYANNDNNYENAKVESKINKQNVVNNNFVINGKAYNKKLSFDIKGSASAYGTIDADGNERWDFYSGNGKLIKIATEVKTYEYNNKGYFVLEFNSRGYALFDVYGNRLTMALISIKPTYKDGKILFILSNTTNGDDEIFDPVTKSKVTK